MGYTAPSKGIRNGGNYLNSHLLRNDYWAKDEQVIGVWVGEAAKMLGVHSRTIGAHDDVFNALRQGLNPTTGEKLTQRMSSKRVALYDFQCSAPKSVSILAVTYNDERLRQAHEEAVRVSFRILEEFAGRRDREGTKANSEEIKTTGTVVAAQFTHDASRELEAQLHTHFVCANATYDTETRKWYALTNRQMWKGMKYAGWVYENELAKRVLALGYRIEEKRDNGKVVGWEIAGVSQDCRDRQSTRSKQIEAARKALEAQNNNRPATRAELNVLARETRARDLKEITTPEVRAYQRGLYTDLENQAHENVIACAKGQASTSIADEHREREALRASALHHMERSSEIAECEVLATALAENLGHIDHDALRKEATHGGQIVRLTDERSGLRRVTTKEILRAEVTCVELVNAGKMANDPFVPTSYRIGDKSSGSQIQLSDDQLQAVKGILFSRDSVVALRGPAGAGKTTVLAEINRGLRDGGYDPVYVAPMHTSKEVVRQGGAEKGIREFLKAETVAYTIAQIEAGKLNLKGRALVVDEGGMVDIRQGQRLIEMGIKAGARIVLVGDEKQNTSVAAGELIAMLRKHSMIDVAELHEIQRQRGNPEYRDAMQAMSEGRVKDATEMLAKMGAIREGKDYLERAATSYHQHVSKGESALIVSPTWCEIDKLNELVRTKQREAGNLKGPAVSTKVAEPVDLTTQQLLDIRNYAIGQAITPTRRLPNDLQKGFSYTITAIDATTEKVTLNNGRAINLKAVRANVTKREQPGKKLTKGKVTQNIKQPTQVSVPFQLGVWKNIEVQRGDKIMPLMSDRARGFHAGEIATVESVTQQGKITANVLRAAGNGRVTATKIEIPASFRVYTHGYAVTSEKSQGTTVDRNIYAAAQDDARRRYVGTSRGRKSVEVYVPDQAHFMKNDANEIPDRASALDRLFPDGYGGLSENSNTPASSVPISAEQRTKIHDALRIIAAHVQKPEKTGRSQLDNDHLAIPRRLAENGSLTSQEAEVGRDLVLEYRAIVEPVSPALYAAAVEGALPQTPRDMSRAGIEIRLRASTQTKQALPPHKRLAQLLQRQKEQRQRFRAVRSRLISQSFRKTNAKIRYISQR